MNRNWLELYLSTRVAIEIHLKYTRHNLLQCKLCLKQWTNLDFENGRIGLTHQKQKRKVDVDIKVCEALLQEFLSVPDLLL